MSDVQKKHSKNTNTFYLWWLNEHTGKRQPAGVAFYEEEYGEYRLKVDALPDHQYYLKTVGIDEDKINYRVEVILKRNGKFSGRRPVGDGYVYPNQDSEIKIDIGPFSKTLTLTLRN